MVLEPTGVSYDDLSNCSSRAANPTQGLRQGNDVGTQYRSGIYVTSDAQARAAEAAKRAYDQALKAQGFASVTSEILPAPEFPSLKSITSNISP